VDRFERIALAVIALLVIAIVTIWAVTPPNGPIAKRPPLPDLEQSHDSVIYAVRSHTRANPEELGTLADRVHHATRAWLHAYPAPDRVERRLPIYVCSSLEAMQQATRHAYWPSAPRPTALRPALGRYLPPAIAIVAVGAGPRVRATVAHEVVHHVMSLFSPNCPPALNEGAAVYLAARHSGWEPSARTQRARASHVRKHGPIELRELIELDSANFHDDQEQAHYVLSHLTVEFLAECEDPRVAGRLPRLYAGIDRNGDPWAYFCGIYDLEHTTRLWQAHVDAFVKRTLERAKEPG